MSAALATRACIVLACLSVIWGGVASGHPTVTIWALVSSGCWLINTFTHRYFWSTFFFLILLMCAAAVGIWRAEWWALSATVFLLCAWDFDSFQKRLKACGKIENDIERAHLSRIGMIAFIGFILGSIPLLWQFSLSLGGALWLATVLVIALVFILRTAGRAAG